MNTNAGGKPAWRYLVAGAVDRVFERVRVQIKAGFGAITCGGRRQPALAGVVELDAVLVQQVHPLRHCMISNPGRSLSP